MQPSSDTPLLQMIELMLDGSVFLTLFDLYKSYDLWHFSPHDPVTFCSFPSCSSVKSSSMEFHPMPPIAELIMNVSFHIHETIYFICDDEIAQRETKRGYVCYLSMTWLTLLKVKVPAKEVERELREMMVKPTNEGSSSGDANHLNNKEKHV